MNRELTQAERSIIDGLYSHKLKEAGDNPLLFWRSPKAKIDSTVFEQLFGLGAVGYLAPFIFHPDTSIAQKALDRIKVLLANMDDVNLGWLDEKIRSV